MTHDEFIITSNFDSLSQIVINILTISLIYNILSKQLQPNRESSKQDVSTQD